MSITWGILKELMLAAMDASDVDTEVERAPQMQWAMRTFAQHTPYQGTYQATITTPIATIEVPSDFLDPRGVFYTNASLQGWAPHLGLSMGAVGKSQIASLGVSYTNLGWWLWPASQINVNNMIGTVDVYYYAHYPTIDPEDETQELPIPDWAIHALIWLSLVYAKIPDSASTSDLARWGETAGEKINPILQQISYFQKQYEWELANHPAVERELIVPESSYGR